MKATKLVMITALVSFALMSFAKAETGLSKNVIHLKTAITNLDIRAAILNQVDGSLILRCKCAGQYTAEVKVNKTVYLVQGTFAEWRIFFRGTAIEKPIYLDSEPGSFNESNPFGTDGTKINPFSEKNPFSKQGKKPTVKKTKGPLVVKY